MGDRKISCGAIIHRHREHRSSNRTSSNHHNSTEKRFINKQTDNHSCQHSVWCHDWCGDERIDYTNSKNYSSFKFFDLSQLSSGNQHPHMGCTELLNAISIVDIRHCLAHVEI